MKSRVAGQEMYRGQLNDEFIAMALLAVRDA